MPAAPGEAPAPTIVSNVSADGAASLVGTGWADDPASGAAGEGAAAGGTTAAAAGPGADGAADGTGAALDPGSDSELAPVPAPPTACPSVGRPAVDVAPGRTPGTVVTSRPANPIVVRPIASGRLTESRVDPKTAIRRRHPVRRRRWASSAERA